jgi:hypothetical protein
MSDPPSEGNKAENSFQTSEGLSQDVIAFVSVVSGDEQKLEKEPSIDDEINLQKSRVIELEQEITRLKVELESRAGSNEAEVLKRQYETKLKDVMDKAKEHARKLAQDRDETRKASEEKDLKLSELRQLVASATKEIGAKDAIVHDQEKKVKEYQQTVDKLQQQMAAMDAHYTKPPSGDFSATMSVKDPSGIEWVLIEDRWWKRHAVSGKVTASLIMNPDEIRTLHADIDKLHKRLESEQQNFSEYKIKVDKILNEKSISTRPHEDPESGIQTAKRLIKLEDDIKAHLSTIESQKKLLSSLQSSEKSLISQIAAAKAEISRLVEPVNQMEAKIVDLRNDKKILSEKLTTARERISELSQQLEETRLSLAIQQNMRTDSSPKQIVEVRPSTDSSSQIRGGESIAVQTDFAPEIMLRTERTPSISAAPETLSSRSSSVVPRNADLHDAIAIPLRHQIRELILELESEKHEHSMTAEQLHVVKEELRKLEAERKLGSDLTDPVKVEYMRNVARTFIALSPNPGPEEFEQLIPVILTFFGLQGDEAISIVKERIKKRQESSFPKLW